MAREVSIPEPRVHIDSDKDTEDEESFVGIPPGGTGWVLRKGREQMKRICSCRRIKVTLGTWAERKKDNEDEAAIIKGPKSERIRVKRKILQEVKNMKKDYKRGNYKKGKPY